MSLAAWIRAVSPARTIGWSSARATRISGISFLRHRSSRRDWNTGVKCCTHPHRRVDGQRPADEGKPFPHPGKAKMLRAVYRAGVKPPSVVFDDYLQQAIPAFQKQAYGGRAGMLKHICHCFLHNTVRRSLDFGWETLTVDSTVQVDGYTEAF